MGSVMGAFVGGIDSLSLQGVECRLTQAGGSTPVSEDSVKGSPVLKVLR